MFTVAIQAGKLLQRPRTRLLVEDNVLKWFFEREQSEAVRNRRRARPAGQAIWFGSRTACD